VFNDLVWQHSALPPGAMVSLHGALPHGAVVFDHPKLLSHLAIRYCPPSQTVDATATEGREVVRGSAQEVVAKREARWRWIDRRRRRWEERQQRKSWADRRLGIE
jgi:hypothetical protein